MFTAMRAFLASTLALPLIACGTDTEQQTQQPEVTETRDDTLLNNRVSLLDTTIMAYQQAISGELGTEDALGENVFRCKTAGTVEIGATPNGTLVRMSQCSMTPGERIDAQLEIGSVETDGSTVGISYIGKLSNDHVACGMDLVIESSFESGELVGAFGEACGSDPNLFAGKLDEMASERFGWLFSWVFGAVHGIVNAIVDFFGLTLCAVDISQNALWRFLGWVGAYGSCVFYPEMDHCKNALSELDRIPGASVDASCLWNGDSQ